MTTLANCPGYTPNFQAMGDCVYCGHVQEDHKEQPNRQKQWKEHMEHGIPERLKGLPHGQESWLGLYASMMSKAVGGLDPATKIRYHEWGQDQLTKEKEITLEYVKARAFDEIMTNVPKIEDFNKELQGIARTGLPVPNLDGALSWARMILTIMYRHR